MVGVAGRSKACVTCKQRKIRCTLEQPECYACQKAGRQCGGYHRDRVFILDSRTANNVRRNTPVPSKAEPEKEAPPKVVLEKNRRKQIVRSRDTVSNEGPISPFNFWLFPFIGSQTAKFINQPIPARDAFISLSSIHCPSTRSCYRQQIVSEFLDTYYDSKSDPTTSESESGGWLAMLPTLPEYTAALEAAVLAICTARLGVVNGNEPLVRESLKFYTQALYELQKALRCPRLRYRDETVATCMALMIYEVIQCPELSVEGWKRHSKGCLKLIEVRGPEACCSELGHRLFLNIRKFLIPQAIAERRSTFLSDQRWLDIPWLGRSKKIDQQILDLMAEMAAITEAGYSLSLEDPYLLTVELLGIIQRGLDLEGKLGEFYCQFEAETQGPIFWDTMKEEPSRFEGGEEWPFVGQYEFPDLLTVQTCLHYWATISILWCGLVNLYAVIEYLQSSMQAPSPSPSFASSSNGSSTGSTISESSYSSSSASASTSSSTTPSAFTPLNQLPQFNLPPLAHRTNIQSLSLKICQALPYYKSQLARSGLPLTVATFPLRVAIEGLSDVAGYEKQLEWALRDHEFVLGKGSKMFGVLGNEIAKKTYLPSVTVEKGPQGWFEKLIIR